MTRGKKKGLTIELDEEELLRMQDEEAQAKQVAPDDFFPGDSGIEYHVTRILPKGPDEGFINVFPAPFYYEDLARDYGGGTYKIHKRLAGSKKFLSTGTFKIAGQPKNSSDVSRGPADDMLLKKITSLEESLKNQSSGGSVLDPKFFQQLLASKLLLQAGSNGSDNAALVSVLSRSGDNQLKALLQGIELARGFSGQGPPEPEEDSIWTKVATAVVSVLERKNFEIKTLNNPPGETSGAQIKVTTTPGMETSEQMLFQRLLLKELGSIILDGIEQNTPVADMANQMRPYAVIPSFKSLLGTITVEEILLYFKAEYSEDPEAMQHLQKPETQTYLTQILEELKK